MVSEAAAAAAAAAHARLTSVAECFAFWAPACLSDCRSVSVNEAFQSAFDEEL